MAPSAAPNTVEEPFPISRIANRYLLFNVDIISHCRRNHNICGMLVGTIPNLSQQNVFLGVPLQLMPEEARVLVEKGAAYIVDDVELHKETFSDMNRDQRLKWLEEMDRRGEEVTNKSEELKEKRKEKALKEKGLKRDGLETDLREDSVAESTRTDNTVQTDTQAVPESDLGFIMKGSSFSDSWVQVSLPTPDPRGTTTSLFESERASPSPSAKTTASQKHFVTPTSSYPPLPTPTQRSAASLPTVPRSYPLFRYLHSLKYYHMPGLRFGCHYNSYPGDPLRYHSHFAATGLDWDEEFELLDIVGGGRLATGTKKAYMIGGENAHVEKDDGLEKENGSSSNEPSSSGGREVRAFSIEWAAL